MADFQVRISRLRNVRDQSELLGERRLLFGPSLTIRLVLFFGQNRQIVRQ